VGAIGADHGLPAAAGGRRLGAELVGRVVPALWQYFSRIERKKHTSPSPPPKEAVDRTLPPRYRLSMRFQRTTRGAKGCADRALAEPARKGRAPVVAVLFAAARRRSFVLPHHQRRVVHELATGELGRATAASAAAVRGSLMQRHHWFA
jgi:hypothetical protein